MSANPPTRSFRVFLLAMSLLALEVALTRIFSFITFHHFTYLVISIAMLGFGAAGSYLTTRKTDDTAPAADEFLAKNAGMMGVTIIAAVVFIPRVHFYPLDMYLYKDYSNLVSFMIIVVITGAPFFFGGTCIGYIISNAGSAINRVYFADLAGAATGSLLVLILINQLGGVATCFFIAMVAMMVAAISSARKRRHYLIGSALTLVLTVLIARTECLPLYAPPDKHMFRMEHLVEFIKWHVITRLDVTRPMEGYFSFGGALSPEYKGEPQKIRVIYQDASNLTGIIQPTPTPQETPALGYYLQGAPYVVKPNANSLVIGCGGGADILTALYYKARYVVGVDVNPNMIYLVKDRYRDFAGGIGQRNDVELVVSEGRHFLGRDKRTFDVIQLSGVDTWSAVYTGAHALTENFIYTREAFDQYLAHLKEGGIVNFSRPFLNPPSETLKLAATSLEALERVNAKHPFEHLVILNGWGQNASMPWAQTMIKRTPFTRAEVELLTNWTKSLGFEVIYDPYTHRMGELETLIRSTPEERARFIVQYPLNINPATDDKPFFFQFQRWHNLFVKKNGIRASLAELILLVSFSQVMILSGILILYPLYRRKTAAAKTGGRVGIFMYFASLGLGFIVVEITLLQKFMVFLGGPAYSMSITLFTILLSSGIGSFLSRNWSRRPFRLLAIAIPLLVAAIIAESLLLDPIIAKFMDLSLFQRGLAVALMVAPLGLLMGMPFPAGLRFVDQYRPELNPWAWGINACATVMGTIVCMLITTSVGFRMALFISAVIYLVGWLILAVSHQTQKKISTGSIIYRSSNDPGL
ncbi:MAG: hypothetical protein NT096_11885 [Proteobacteria bacterium]|nr:hypothetical protein [Pseudomonadota bacterium]